MKSRLRLISFCFLWTVVQPLYELKAQNWPAWRGPNGDGTSIETNLPTQWDSISNVSWKSKVPGGGHSSPIVWENRIFMLSALMETQERVLLCFDEKNGELLWQQTVIHTPLEKIHPHNSYASGTPATDGKLIYVSMLDGENVLVAAYDFNGKQVWKERPGTFSSPHGFSCSPVLYKNSVIINGNSQKGGFLAALNKSDGRLIWKTDHPEAAHSFSTPLIREAAGKMQLFFGGNKITASYNPDDGSMFWFVKGPSEDFCSTPVYNEKQGLLFLSSAWPKRILLAIRPDGSGDVTESHVQWQTTKGAYYVPSPVCTDQFLFSTMTNGVVHCLDISTGSTLWEEKLGKQYSSAVLADGLVYMPNDEGQITVIKPGPTFVPVSTNSIGETMNAPPAISNGKIYLRGEKHLFCIEKSN